MEYVNLHLQINEILEEKGISKNKICKDLDKFCRDVVCLFNTGLICKLYWYLNIGVGALIEY